MLVNLIKIIKYQLYLLQLENYELGRYLKLLRQKGYFPPKAPMRKSLVWTGKATLILLLAIGLYLTLPWLIFWKFLDRLPELGIKNYELWFLGFVYLLIFYFLFFIFYLIGIVILWPVDWLLKQVIIYKAKSKIQSLTVAPDLGSRMHSPGATARKELSIIGIAGSYGKTTMKEVLKAVLGLRFQVFATPESVNTPVGIARWVLKNFNAPNPSSAPQAPSPLKGEENIEIAIIEMGEHYKGDIKAICSLVKPDMAVVTGISEAHLERMGSIKAVTQTIFEIVQNAKADALCLLNGDDENVVENYQNYILPKQKNIKYQISNIKHAKFDAVRLGWELEIPPLTPPNIGGEEARGNTNIGGEGERESSNSGEERERGNFNSEKEGERESSNSRREGERGDFNSGEEGERGNFNSGEEGKGVKIFVKLLGEYALGDVDCAISIARELGMSNEAIKQGIEKIQPVKHRLEPILRPGNILVIDDAYNGNSVGVKEAIKTLAQFPNRRKIYITPGLVETGSEVKTVHLEIGKQLAKVADVVILIRNSVTGYIELGIKNYELSKRENLQLTTYNLPIIIWFNSAEQAHAELKNLLQPNDVILFQNDWGDQYI